FYGSLAFSVTVTFGIHVWLEFKIGWAKISLDISFSERLCVTVALEIAATPGRLRGRAAGPIPVPAFRPSPPIRAALRVYNELLRGARARVERCLALGLEAALPDPEKGLAPPPAKANTNANKTIEDQAKKAEQALGTETTPPAEPGKKPDITGGNIGAPKFWA